MTLRVLAIACVVAGALCGCSNGTSNNGADGSPTTDGFGRAPTALSPRMLRMLAPYARHRRRHST